MTVRDRTDDRALAADVDCAPYDAPGPVGLEALHPEARGPLEAEHVRRFVMTLGANHCGATITAIDADASVFAQVAKMIWI